MSGTFAGVSAAVAAGSGERSTQALQSFASASSAAQGTGTVATSSRVSMSHIQGVKKPLVRANSITGDRLPKFGVETCHEEELGKVQCCSYFDWRNVVIASVWARERKRTQYVQLSCLGAIACGGLQLSDQRNSLPHHTIG